MSFIDHQYTHPYDQQASSFQPLSTLHTAHFDSNNNTLLPFTENHHSNINQYMQQLFQPTFIKDLCRCIEEIFSDRYLYTHPFFRKILMQDKKGYVSLETVIQQHNIAKFLERESLQNIKVTIENKEFLDIFKTCLPKHNRIVRCNKGKIRRIYPFAFKLKHNKFLYIQGYPEEDNNEQLEELILNKTEIYHIKYNHQQNWAYLYVKDPSKVFQLQGHTWRSSKQVFSIYNLEDYGKGQQSFTRTIICSKINKFLYSGNSPDQNYQYLDEERQNYEQDAKRIASERGYLFKQRRGFEKNESCIEAEGEEEGEAEGEEEGEDVWEAEEEDVGEGEEEDVGEGEEQYVFQCDELDEDYNMNTPMKERLRRTMSEEENQGMNEKSKNIIAQRKSVLLPSIQFNRKLLVKDFL